MIKPDQDDFINDTVTITVDEYLTLLEDQKFLRTLEHLGVDNWDGYQEAVSQWRND